VPFYPKGTQVLICLHIRLKNALEHWFAKVRDSAGYRDFGSRFCAVRYRFVCLCWWCYWCMCGGYLHLKHIFHLSVFLNVVHVFAKAEKVIPMTDFVIGFEPALSMY
jgi:hypothetical protein